MSYSGAALRVRDIHVTYDRGRVTALRGVNLDVRHGERVALLGPNGAGKSTLTHVMLGLLAPTAGEVQVLGKRPRAAVDAGEIGAMLQETGLMREIRVGELVKLVTGLYGGQRKPADVLAEVGLEDLPKRSVSALSGGQRQRLKLALALAGDPKFLFLDEPTVALDVEARRRFWSVLATRAGIGITVLFTTHYLEEAEQNADRVVVLREGLVVADGTVNAVRSTMAGQRITFHANPVPDQEVLEGLPGVRTAEVHDDKVVLNSTNSDATLPALYQAIADVRDLSVTAASLEDALVELFQKES
ncbi:ABC-2 type transport system ATP-binding protein [Amycolatopsis lexingtonensis]|uniref:ABC-2 type transport system ATP-binding protein n=1 Tax=Amycolatopsis lexingtonensis TaxID=218822 RepID=A0ABR9HQF1_9PSEU|nr:ABC transporter ATP-binding protein [Amycolatopsis lexingtonensis]MBE1493149.1 ABC-2 type transport system ATP-binding protein [Amycolatopsis lexingtonensis]